MGLDYSYKLYFPRPRLPEALLGLAALCVPGKTMGEIRFPQGLRQVPFEPFREDKAPNWDDESYSFDLILNLEADQALEQFTRIDPQTLHAQGDRLNLGHVYFRVDNPPENQVSQLTFIAGGNRMSWAFLDSHSLQSAFSRLLAAHGGICGALNREEDRIIFWWRGEATWEVLEDAWTLEEVERAMRRKQKQTPSPPSRRRRYRCLKK
ncbi:MAG: hypothetical protein ACPLYD_14610 [Anaerolineae bacterium]